MPEVSRISSANALQLRPVTWGSENMRQNALHVGCHLNWEYVEKVVFGYSMPESNEEFADMCADSDAWESEYNVLRSIRYW